MATFPSTLHQWRGGELVGMATNPGPRGGRGDALSGHVDSGRTAGEHDSQARGPLIDAASPLDLSLMYLSK